MEVVRKTTVKFNESEQKIIEYFLNFINELGCDHIAKPECEMCPFKNLCGASLEDIMKQMEKIYK